jgi:GT2 family glycosyltransferase
MEKIAVLITCFNRREITINCLTQLFFLNKNIDVYLVDDNSSDGTYEAIVEQFPQVNIFKGSGVLYWSRGMLKAWEYASVNDYDSYIWLNDDVFLYENSFQEIRKCAIASNYEAIICGAFETKDKSSFSYGGRDKNTNAILPNGQLQDVYYLNGNFVFIPSQVFKKLGMLDKLYWHHKGDYDYGFKALKAGIKVLSTTSYVGTCDLNVIISDRGRKSGVSLKKRFTILYSPMGNSPNVEFIFRYRYFGFVNALLVYIKLHFINLLPDSFFFNARKYFSRF